jgi:RHS repeat-associated protein
VPFRSADPHKIPIDPNGNLATKTEGSDSWVYSWNAENQLTKVEKNGAEQARFAYDPRGRRVESVSGGATTTFTYDKTAILREMRASQSLKYTHGLGVDEPLAVDDGTTVSFFHADALGSIAKTSDATGAGTTTRQYDAWGRPEMEQGAPGYAFTGREWDSNAGLYYYRARYYDAATGRFLSEDPLGLRASLNLYMYANDNPVRFTDPSGRSVVDCYNYWDAWGKCQEEVRCCVKNMMKQFENMTLEQQVEWLEEHETNYPSDAMWRECFWSNPNCVEAWNLLPRCATTFPFGGWFTRLKIFREINRMVKQ